MRFLTLISTQRWRHASFAACLAALSVPVSQTAPGSTHWIGSWATSQQLPEAQNSLPVEDLRDATLRQIVHLSIGGQQLRVHLSNRFGTAPLHFAAVHIARPTLPVSGGITVATDTVLTFSGKTDVTVPAGADYVSDPVAFPVVPLSDLAISLQIDAPPATQTGHPGSHATSYIVHGNRLSAGDLPEAKKLEHWYFLAGVDVNAPAQAAAIAVSYTHLDVYKRQEVRNEVNQGGGRGRETHDIPKRSRGGYRNYMGAGRQIVKVIQEGKNEQRSRRGRTEDESVDQPGSFHLEGRLP